MTLPLNSWKRGYGPPPLVLTFTDDPPLWDPSPPPPPRKNVPSLTKQYGVSFITRVKRQKDRETVKKTANVQMPRTVGVVQACQPPAFYTQFFSHTDHLIAGTRSEIRCHFMWQGEMATRITFDWCTNVQKRPKCCGELNTFHFY